MLCGHSIGWLLVTPSQSLHTFEQDVVQYETLQYLLVSKAHLIFLCAPELLELTYLKPRHNVRGHFRLKVNQLHKRRISCMGASL